MFCWPRLLGFLSLNDSSVTADEIKTFTIYPATRTLRWMQCPENRGGFTAAQTGMHSHHGRAVLLQREDYAVQGGYRIGGRGVERGHG